MSVIFPFRALRPRPDKAALVAAPPYDVLTVEEAKVLVRDLPLSFLHVEKSEVDVPFPTDDRDGRIFAVARRNLRRMQHQGVFVQDETPCLYLYRQTRGGHVQTGLVACVSVEEYEEGLIRRHEETRADKQEERTRHVETVGAHTGPVFLTYRGRDEIRRLVAGHAEAPPECAFVADDGVGHAVWAIRDPGAVAALVQAFAAVDALYIADGHHRAAAAAAVAKRRQESDPEQSGDAPCNRFLAVLVPHDEVRILDYNRVVRDLNGQEADLFVRRVGERFEVTPGFARKSPEGPRTFGMYLRGAWHRLAVKEGGIEPDDPVARLDVSILQNRLLEPILGIQDPRTDSRIHFVGGSRGMEELERLVDTGGFAVAFSLFPPSLDDLMAVADAQRMMPPKSTWFEPKLRSGLFVHLID